MVPITLISCMLRGDIDVESTTRNVCTMVSMRAARTIRASSE
jgi:hypothetical protein